MAETHFTDARKGLLDLDRQIKGIRTGHVSVVRVQDHWHLLWDGPCFIGGILGREGVGHIDHVGNFAYCFSNGDMIYMDSCQRLGRQRRAKEIIGLESANRFP